LLAELDQVDSQDVEEPPVVDTCTERLSVGRRLTVDIEVETQTLAEATVDVLR